MRLIIIKKTSLIIKSHKSFHITINLENKKLINLVNHNSTEKFKSSFLVFKI